MADKPTGYPRCWLNDQGHVKCMARGCHKVWKTQYELRWRYNHLIEDMSKYGGHQTETDHDILLAMNKQTKCPHCCDIIVRGRRSVKDLYQHELEIHNSQYTATISGFVKLLRKGLIEPKVARLASEPVHQRLLQMIMTSPDYHGPWGLADFWHIGDPVPSVNMWLLASIITTPNQKDGKPWNYPMKPDRFLSDLPPQFNERQIAYNWAGMWTRLRQMYAKGEI